MFNISSIIVVVFVAGVSYYTFSFARQTAKKKNLRGAVGLYILTAITFILPLWLYFLRPF